jgi:hypothetical protein
VRAGAVIGQSWAIYKAHWRHLLPIALVVYVVISLLSLLLVVLLGWVGAIASALVSLAGVFWLQGALVIAIDDVRDGRADLNIAQTLDRVLPRLNTLALAGVLAALGITIGFILLIVPGLFLLTIWLLIVPAIVLEGCGVFDSFGRSRELVRGYGWSVFGVIVLTVLILLGVEIVKSIVESVVDAHWASVLIEIITSSATAPLLALSWTLTYFELRRLKEAVPAAPPEPAPSV